MKKTALVLMFVALASSALVAGCAPPPVSQASTAETAAAPATQDSTAEPTSVPESVVAANEVIQVEVTDYGWAPDVITIAAGEQVTLELTNTGKMPHGIYIPALGINEGVRSGRTILVDILAPSTPGEFAIKCNDPMCGTMLQHSGMVATLIITE